MLIVNRLEGTTEYYNFQFIKTMLYNPDTKVLEIYDQDDNAILVMPNNKFDPKNLEIVEYKNVFIDEKN